MFVKNSWKAGVWLKMMLIFLHKINLLVFQSCLRKAITVPSECSVRQLWAVSQHNIASSHPNIMGHQFWYTFCPFAEQIMRPLLLLECWVSSDVTSRCGVNIFTFVKIFFLLLQLWLGSRVLARPAPPRVPHQPLLGQISNKVQRTTIVQMVSTTFLAFVENICVQLLSANTAKSWHSFMLEYFLVLLIHWDAESIVTLNNMWRFYTLLLPFAVSETWHSIYMDE